MERPSFSMWSALTSFPLTLTRRSLADRKSTRLNSSHTVIYTLSLHDALPICVARGKDEEVDHGASVILDVVRAHFVPADVDAKIVGRSEERRVGKECRSLCDWSSDVCSSDLRCEGQRRGSRPWSVRHSRCGPRSLRSR